MRLWRLCREPYATLDGAGSLRAGARWHNRGTAVVYTASTPSLSALEYLVHVDPAFVPSDLVLLEVVLPDSLAIEDVIDPSTLSPEWRVSPGPPELRAFGSAWAAEQRSPLLRVPSALLPVGADVESNIIINPALLPPGLIASTHPFSFDGRLL